MSSTEVKIKKKTKQTNKKVKNNSTKEHQFYKTFWKNVQMFQFQRIS